MIFLQLFLGFLRIGLFSFGGAYSAIPLIKDVVTQYGWISEERLTDMIAVSESTPGPIMVNLATYIGSTTAGFLGALIATLAVVIPAFVIIIVIVRCSDRLKDNKYLNYFLAGLIPCIIGIICATGIYMLFGTFLFTGPVGRLDIRALIIAGILISTMIVFKKVLKKNLSPILMICIGAGLGMIFYAV